MSQQNPNKRIANILKEANIIEEKAIVDVEKKIRKIYKNGLDNVRRDLSEMFSEYGKAVKRKVLVDYETMDKYGRLDKLSQKIAAKFKNTRKDIDKQIREAIKESYRENYYIHSFAIDSSYDISFYYKALSAEAIRAALINDYTKIQWPERLKDSVNVLNTRVQDQIVKTLHQGLGYKKSAKVFAEEIGIGVGKAKRILWTETHRAQNLGHLESHNHAINAAERVGVNIEKMWISTLDERTRYSHRRLDGDIADKDGYFHYRNWKSKAPGTWGIASMDINCRCRMSTHFPDLPPRYRYDKKAGKIKPYMNYKEWQKQHNIKAKREL